MNEVRSVTEKPIKVNKTLMKEWNRVLVIDQIRNSDGVSRSQIAKNTGLGLSSLTSIVKELISENLVYEVEKGESSGGRRPILLKFNEDFGYLVGVKIERDKLIFCRSNLSARPVVKEALPYQQRLSNDDVNELLIKGIETIIGDCPRARLLGIGIAVSGLVNRKEHLVIHSPILAWENYEFGRIAQAFKVPVLVENDSNVFSLGQIWGGVGAQYRNFIGVIVGAGVGAGIVLNRRLYRGEFGGAGEIGHTVIQQEGVPCYCGQRGCLEMYASDKFVVSEAQRLVAMKIPTKLSALPQITPEDVYQAAAEGDQYAREILVKQGSNLGLGLRNVVNLLNPGAIILGGESLRGREFILEGLRKELRSHFFAKHKQDLELHLCDLGEDAFLIGACALVGYDLFKAPIYT
jgi:predicted NBD/HSP70 family sugar kinase